MSSSVDERTRAQGAPGSVGVSGEVAGSSTEVGAGSGTKPNSGAGVGGVGDTSDLRKLENPGDSVALRRFLDDPAVQRLIDDVASHAPSLWGRVPIVGAVVRVIRGEAALQISDSKSGATDGLSIWLSERGRLLTAANDGEGMWFTTVRGPHLPRIDFAKLHGLVLELVAERQGGNGEVSLLSPVLRSLGNEPYGY